MWYIFPQIDGLAFGSTSKYYAIKSIDEAKAYLEHPILAPRLNGRTTEKANGTPGEGDAQKSGPSVRGARRRYTGVSTAEEAPRTVGRGSDGTSGVNAFFGGEILEMALFGG
jgi:hypothetical protein